MKWSVLFASSLALLGCLNGSPPARSKPPVAGNKAPVDPVARQLAPQAHARMEALEREASRAFQTGDAEQAAITGEAASAARQHVRVLSQLAQFESRRRAAVSALTAERRSLQAAAEVLQGLEARAVALEGQLLVDSGSARNPDGMWPEHLAEPALQTLMLQARMLCLSVQLLGHDKQAQALGAQLDVLEGETGNLDMQARINQAAEIKRSCLDALMAHGASRVEAGTSVRAARVQTGADQLLTRLSSAGFQPVRDERGVVVSLPLQVAEGQGSSLAEFSAGQLAQVAAQEPGCTALVVGHAGTEGQGVLVERELERLRQLLVASGIERVGVYYAGLRQPLVPPMLSSSARYNGRLEVVFLSANW